MDVIRRYSVFTRDSVTGVYTEYEGWAKSEDEMTGKATKQLGRPVEVFPYGAKIADVLLLRDLVSQYPEEARRILASLTG